MHKTFKDKLVRNLAILGFSLCMVVVTVYRFTRGSWLNGVLAGITLAMAMLPEEFPVALTIFLWKAYDAGTTG